MRRAIAGCWCALVLFAASGRAILGAPAPAPRPNILWLTSEDHGPHLGCYGDPLARTPVVDGLAARGMMYARVWSCAPVCAPARTTLISGLYPTSTGSEAMRSLIAYPAGKEMLPQLLRAAGYYCTNNAKEDYNLAQPGAVWDESSRGAHWKKRRSGQPFFAVFNSEKSHESQIRTRPHMRVLDPAQVRVPAYHPDTPEVRQDWAQYYDKVSEADADAGRRLKELADAGLDDETIIFYFSDHGSGMPRNKRSPCNSGLHVPLVVYIPEKFRSLRPADYAPGGRSERLVSFVDFAPTVLSLAGIEPPAWMQGHAFLGPFAAPPQAYIFGFRGRMDERIDLARSVTDGQYVYVRNYMPHRVYGQHLQYMFQTATTRVWKRLHDEGRLNPAQDAFWNPKPPEELYDLARDSDEVDNLATSPAHGETLKRLRGEHEALARRIRDLGFLPEGEMWARAKGLAPYDMGQDDTRYPFERIFRAAGKAAGGVAEGAARETGQDREAVRQLIDFLGDEDCAVRYWGAMGLLIRGEAAVGAAREELARALDDPSPYPRIVAAEALLRYPDPMQGDKPARTLIELADWSRQDVFAAMTALNAIDISGSPELRRQAALLPARGPVPDARYSSYVPRLLQDLTRQSR